MFHLHARFHDNHHKLIESTAIGPGGVRTLGRHITRARWKFTTHPDRLLRTIIGEGAKFESNHQSLSPKTIICQGGKISPKTTLKYHLQGRKIWENFPPRQWRRLITTKNKISKNDGGEIWLLCFMIVTYLIYQQGWLYIIYTEGTPRTPTGLNKIFNKCHTQPEKFSS